MGGAHIRLSPVRVVEVVHGFPVLGGGIIV